VSVDQKETGSRRRGDVRKNQAPIAPRAIRNTMAQEGLQRAKALFEEMFKEQRGP
jgi:hypothetical protein